MTIRRPDPNFAITWALALLAPIQIAIGIWCVLALEPLHRFLLGLVAAAMNGLLATLDGQRIQGLPDRVPTRAALAAASPLLHLLVRMLHDPDPRAGRPFWTAIATTPVALLLLVMSVIGRYAAHVHGC